MDWNERLRNQYLIEALGADAFQDGVLGCYFNFRSMSLPILEYWLDDAEEDVRHQVLACYLSALWIEEAALATRRVAQSLGPHSLLSERKALASVQDRVEAWLPEPLRHLAPADAEITLTSLQALAGGLRDYLWSSATIGMERAGNVAARLRLNRVQEITNDVFTALAEILCEAKPQLPWTFRICMDEGEFLSEAAALTVRTLVRQCVSPLLIVVAYLSDLGVDTLYKSVTLTHQDRYVLNLENRTQEDMRKLVEGIVNTRLRNSAYETRDISLSRLLGAPDLNDLLMTLSRSENPRLHELQKRWTDRPDSETWRSKVRGDSPIREYLRWTGSIEESNPPTRLQDSVGYRKKKVNGYLHLLRSLGVREPFYAGVTIALSMSDNSLRNMLMFLEEARLAWCRERGLSDTMSLDAVDGFLRLSPVPFEFQDRGLRELGSSRLRDLRERIIHYTFAAQRLVDLLGIMSHIVDFGEPGRAVAIEQRRFRVKFAPTPTAATILGRADLERQSLSDVGLVFLAVLRECQEEGFLHLDEVDLERNEVSFEVNSSFARHYGFNYHAPSYTRWVDWTPIRQALEDDSLRNLGKLAERAIASRRPPGERSLAVPGQGSLFAEGGEDDAR